MATKSPRKNHRKRNLDEVPLTPMVDIVFQLLIFFIYTFDPVPKQTVAEVARPQLSHQVSVAESHSLRIFVWPKTHAEAASMPVYTLEDQTARSCLSTLQTFLVETAALDREIPVIVTAMVDSYHNDLMAVLDLCSLLELDNLIVMSGKGR